MRSETDAVFTDMLRTACDGTTVKKTSGNSNWNGGALSTAGVSNNGYSETVITQTNKNRIFGLSHLNNPNSNTQNSVEYAIELTSYWIVLIKESGSYLSFAGFYTIGDIFRIAVEDGEVKYYKNGSLLYESTTTPTLPLYVDLAFQDEGGEISQVTIGNTSGTTISAFTATANPVFNTYNWYKNNTLLSQSGPEITLDDISNNDIITCSATPLSGNCAGIELHSNSLKLTPDATTTPDSDLRITNSATENGCYLALEDVFWKANIPENIEITGHNVTKIAGYKTSNGGFYSENKVYNNGFLKFQTNETNARKMVGLSTQDNGNSESTIQFAFYIEWEGSLSVYEHGNWRGGFGSVSPGDVMRIAVENHQVKYYKNDELLYTSDETPNLPLVADGTIQDIGATITDAFIANPTQGVFIASAPNSNGAAFNWTRNGQSLAATGTTLTLDEFSENDLISCSYISTLIGCGDFTIQSNSIQIIPNNQPVSQLFYSEGVVNQNGIGIAEEEVVWNPTSLINVTNTNNSLTKVQGYNQYDAGASSLNTVKINGYFDFPVTETNKKKAIGLSTTDLNTNNSSIDYAIYLTTYGAFSIYESGTWRLGNQSYSAGDIFRIAVENNTVKYYKNQTLIYTSNTTPTLPLLVDVSLATTGGTIQNAVVGNINNGVFTANLAGLGSNPLIQWKINGEDIGAQSNPLTYDDIENDDIITCTVVPDFSGCNVLTSSESNEIRFIRPVTTTNWTGAVSSVWENQANWSDGVPNSVISAKITGGRPHQPVVSITADVKNILVKSNASLTITSNASLLVYGNFILNGTFDAESGSVAFNGSGNRKIKGDNLIFNKLIVNLSDPNTGINLKSTISIANETTFIRGNIITHNHEVIYLNGSLSREGNSESFIDGKARKIGNSDFLFPIGTNGVYAPIEISAPNQPTDAFTAQYYNEDPNIAGYSTDSQDGTLNTISTCEYWMLNELSGHSSLNVTLSYENLRSCGVSDPSSLQVLHWNGSEWENKGLSSFEGDTLSGRITSLQPIEDFSPFTIGSLSRINPLPIELTSFTATKIHDHKAQLSWITETETNNSYFTLESSIDAVHFTELGQINGAGTSHEKMTYHYIDESPHDGINYYRLSQTDFDGHQTYFDIHSLYFESNTSIAIYPNPSHGAFTIQRESDSPIQLILTDATGKIRWVNHTNERFIRVDIPDLSKGFYFLKIEHGHATVIEKVVIE